MERKELYQEKMEAQLQEWQAKFDELKAKARQASADAHLQYEKQIDALQPKLEAAKQKLRELQLASDNAWGDVKVGMEGAWNELKTTWGNVLSRFS